MISPATRVLALDYGRSRIGAAVSDALGLTASPLPAFDGRDVDRALRSIAHWCAEEGIGRVLLGLPLTLDGREGPAVIEVRRFRDRLQAALPDVEVEEVDERLSSKEAHALLRDAGVRHRQRKGLVDSTAAALLLRTWLAKRRAR